MFILAATDDPLGLAPQSVALYQDWTAAKKSAELHLYSKGGHGFGMRKQSLPTDHWIERFADWLEVQGLLKKMAPRITSRDAPTALGINTFLQTASSVSPLVEGPLDLRRIHAVETNPHPDPLPIRKGERTLRLRVRAIEQGSVTGAF